MSLLTSIVVLLMIMDPIGNVPVFLATLSSLDAKRRRRVLIRELLIALVILVVFLFFGQVLLKAMNISAPALSVSGGVVLFLIALRMIFRGPGGEAVEHDRGQEEPLIVPLAMPMIAGPSTMAMVVLMATREPDRIWEWLAALLIAWGLTATVLMAAEPLGRLLKDTGMKALVRLMGMILTAMSIQMILDGLTEYWRSVAL